MPTETPPTSTTAERIAEVALEILEGEGPDAVTMRRVAQAVGITPMAIYHHFPNRDAMLQAITDAEFENLRALIETRKKQSTAHPKSRLVQLMAGYLDYALQRPRVFDYVFSRPRPGARQFPDDFRARRSPTLNLVADGVAEAMQAGKLKKDDCWEVALELWALIHGYVALYRAGRFHLSEEDFRALCERSIRRLLHGIQS
ncbi:MAG TPA: TetR/AcrR family transcriptional regulator [Acidobacteriaceae bacterium]|jgi:AcrR family transcriptional regulator|nr:TetR/AcrR family transcriptional regulator [Acidobacteriaceae bacterium]